MPKKKKLIKKKILLPKNYGASLTNDSILDDSIYDPRKWRKAEAKQSKPPKKAVKKKESKITDLVDILKDVQKKYGMSEEEARNYLNDTCPDVHFEESNAAFWTRIIKEAGEIVKLEEKLAAKKKPKESK